MKSISENGARPVPALGEATLLPFGRLGALVFQPHKTEPLYWASPWASTRIAGCAGGSQLLIPAGKTFSPKGLSCGWIILIRSRKWRGAQRSSRPPVPSDLIAAPPAHAQLGSHLLGIWGDVSYRVSPRSFERNDIQPKPSQTMRDH